jgi:hypothetical protein
MIYSNLTANPHTFSYVSSAHLTYHVHKSGRKTSIIIIIIIIPFRSSLSQRSFTTLYHSRKWVIDSITSKQLTAARAYTNLKQPPESLTLGPSPQHGLYWCFLCRYKLNWQINTLRLNANISHIYNDYHCKFISSESDWNWF